MVARFQRFTGICSRTFLFHINLMFWYMYPILCVLFSSNILMLINTHVVNKILVCIN